MNTQTSIEGNELEDAVAEQLKAHYASEAVKQRQPGEWTLSEYMAANNIPESQRLQTSRRLARDATISVRKNGIANGRSCYFYSFKK